MSKKHSPYRMGSKVANLPIVLKEEVVFYQQRHMPMPIGIIDAAKAARKGVGIVN